MENTLKWIPAYSILLIFITLYCLSSYYDNFGIEIYNYIDISEIFLIGLPIFNGIFSIIQILGFMLFIIVFLSILGLAFTSTKQLVYEGIQEKENEKRGTTQELDVEHILHETRKKVGFHILDRIPQLFSKKFYTSNCKSEIITEWLLAIFTVGTIVFFTVCAFWQLLENVREIKGQTEKFYKESKSLVVGSIFLTFFIFFFICQLLRPKFLWDTYFKNLFKAEFIPLWILFLYFIISYFEYQARYLQIVKAKQTDIYLIMLLLQQRMAIFLLVERKGMFF